MFSISVSSFAQQQVEVKMTVTNTVESSNPMKDAIVAQVGNDEASIIAAMNKIKEQQASGKRVMTRQEFTIWKSQVNTKLKSLSSPKDQLEMKAFIAKKTSEIVILEDII